MSRCRFFSLFVHFSRRNLTLFPLPPTRIHLMERKIEFAPGKELRIEGSAEWHPPVELSSSSSRISDLAAAAAAQPHEWRAPIPVSGQIYFHYRGKESGPLKSSAAIRSATILSAVTCQLQLPSRELENILTEGA